MKKSGLLCMMGLAIVMLPVASQTHTIKKEALRDKIMGAWAGQLIGCTFGGPTEFRWNSTFIPDYFPIAWNDTLIEWWYDHAPGLYDDIYMDLTFVRVFDEKGLDAPAEDFARAFAYAEYPLWHANQAARYNILNGIMPPESGHWLHNPHAEDIDYQIEADFAGIMSPGMPNTASEISDKIGHIMNYGDGWYGGIYVGAMYALAYIHDDVEYVVEEALKAVPRESRFYQCQADVIRHYRQHPDNWKMTWIKIQEKWGEDVGCPDGVFRPFNIDAKINAAWIILGLLYGEGDFGKTVSISTRAGDDSDCNPANAAGILGTMTGYKNIPEYWKQGIAQVADRDFEYTDISLNDAYRMSFEQALEVIEAGGGTIESDRVVIKLQQPEPVRLEVGFEGHHPAERRRLGIEFSEEAGFTFQGIGFSCTGSASMKGTGSYWEDPEQAGAVDLEVEMYVDGELVETSKMPTNWLKRKNTAFWRFQLDEGRHQVRLKVVNPVEGASISLNDLIVYRSKPPENKY